MCAKKKGKSAVSTIVVSFGLYSRLNGGDIYQGKPKNGAKAPIPIYSTYGAHKLKQSLGLEQAAIFKCINTLFNSIT